MSPYSYFAPQLFDRASLKVLPVEVELLILFGQELTALQDRNMFAIDAPEFDATACNGADGKTFRATGTSPRGKATTIALERSLPSPQRH